jgi:hypothetical protein
MDKFRSVLLGSLIAGFAVVLGTTIDAAWADGASERSINVAQASRDFIIGLHSAVSGVSKLFVQA